MPHPGARFLPRSIRGRLLVIVLAAVVITAALVTVISVSIISGFLNSRLEQRINTIAGQIAAVAERAPERTADATALRTFLPADSLVLLEPAADRTPVTFGTDALDTEVIADVASDLPERTLRRIDVAASNDGDPVTSTVAVVRVDTEGLRVRLEGLEQPITTDFIVFAIDISQDVATLTRLSWIEGGVGALVILAVGVASVFIIRLGVRPLTVMASTADAITSGDRSQRLPVGDGGAETDHLAASINRALDAQQHAEDRLRAFLDDVSHELRTPLTTVNGWIDLYLQGGLQDDAERDRAMERVESEVARMRILVDELTLLSRLDAHRALDMTDVNLAVLAREVVNDARVVADGRNITVDTENVVVVGDPARMAQVLRNLVGNAVQHTPPGTGVDVDVARNGQEAIVKVHDHGPGIADADLPHLFERFWRAEPSRSRATGGSGLGLAIVASIVNAHRGAIRVTSNAEVGTTFVISLPISSPGPTGLTGSAAMT